MVELNSDCCLWKFKEEQDGQAEVREASWRSEDLSLALRDGWSWPGSARGGERRKCFRQKDGSDRMYGQQSEAQHVPEVRGVRN